MDKIDFVNNSEPDLSAENLNLLQTNVENAINNVEQVKSYDLTQYKTSNVNNIIRIICKKQGNVVQISGTVATIALKVKKGGPLFQGLPKELTPSELFEGMAMNNSTGEIYRIYINTDGSLHIYPVASSIPANQQVFINLSYIV